MVYIEDVEAPEDHRNKGVYWRPQYTLEEAKEVARWLNEPRELMNAHERVYYAILRFHRDKGVLPNQIKLDEAFYYEVLRVSTPLVWGPEPFTTFYGVPFTRHKNQDVDYILEGEATVQ
jgi:hypothetical protein